ncbi:hypothetical protein FRC02_003701 [Tulasnella sp. 418]|nr:hypothetical protein FRC02_003701 [Tulasnella sp. 418]
MNFNHYRILPFTSFSAFVFSSTIAPRTQIYIQLACEQHRPELYFTTPRVIGISDWSNGNLSAEIYLPSHPQGYGTFEEMKPVRSFTNDVVLNFAGHDEGPPRKKLTKRPSSTNPRCNKDPIVLAAVARIVTVTALIVGILTCLTAPWWGELSDAYGRRRILMFTTLGVLFSESNLILVSFLHSSLPGGYWFLVLSSILDGAFGGLATASATTHAYLADCTEPSSRSKYFSMYTGILFTGIAAGPSFGSLLVSYTDDLLMVFYLALGVHIMLLLFIWTVLPESISPETIQALAEEREERVKAREQERIRARAEGSTRLNRLAGLAAFLRPLRIFLPKSRPNGQPGKDWNLFCLVIVYGIMTTYLAMFQYKSQYAIAVFGWNAEQLGYWLSAFGFARAAHLIVVLPVIIKLLKPKVQPISLDDNTRIPSDTEQPTHSRQSSPSTYPAPAGLPPRIAAQFDLTIARVSILVDVVAYLALSVSVAQSTFWWSSIMASFGGGLIPAIQSLALVLTKDEKHEPGRVFGALSMVQALG